MGAAGAGGLEGEAGAGFDQDLHPLDHQPAGGQRRTFGIERRKPAGNFVGVDEFPDPKATGQQGFRRRRLARTIGAAEDGDVLHA